MDYIELYQQIRALGLNVGVLDTQIEFIEITTDLVDVVAVIYSNKDGFVIDHEYDAFELLPKSVQDKLEAIFNDIARDGSLFLGSKNKIRLVKKPLT